MNTLSQTTSQETHIQTLQEDKIRFDLALEAARLGVWDWWVQSDKLIWNDILFQLFDKDPATFKGTHNDFLQCLHPEDRHRVQQEIKNALNDIQEYNTEYRSINRQGHTRYFKAKGIIIKDSQGKVIRMTGVCIDISTEKQYKQQIENYLQEIQESEERFRRAVNGTTDGIWDWIDINEDAEWWSDRYYEMLGYEVGEIDPGTQAFKELLHPDDVERTFNLVAAHFAGLADYDIEYRLRMKNGHYKWVRARGTCERNSSGIPLRMTGCIQDIDKRKRAEFELERIANHDFLTQLPNRNAFMQLMDNAVHHAVNKDEKFALIYIDVDDFKKVNDTLGHTWGDRLLLEITKRLQSALREGDYIARLGGDEFVVIASQITCDHDCILLAERILHQFNQPYSLSNRLINCTVSIGIATYPHTGKSTNKLLKAADIAMYEAKAQGKSTYQFFTTALNEKVQRRHKIERHMAQAITNNELTVVYQPLINLSSYEPFGVECLLRWHNPQLGDISPEEFIPIAEETGFIHDLGAWVIERTCLEIGLLKQYNPFLKNLRLSVNFSVLQLSQPTIYQHILDQLKLNDIPAAHFILEITETALMKNVATVMQVLHNLHNQNINIAIDDFGTGYSSLSYVKKLPITFLKIDQSFIHDISCNNNDAAIAQAIIQLGKILEVEVIAEGVERFDQLAFLQANHCDYVQGNYFNEPMPIGQLNKRFQKHHPTGANKLLEAI